MIYSYWKEKIILLSAVLLLAIVSLMFCLVSSAPKKNITITNAKPTAALVADAPAKSCNPIVRVLGGCN